MNIINFKRIEYETNIRILKRIESNSYLSIHLHPWYLS